MPGPGRGQVAAGAPEAPEDKDGQEERFATLCDQLQAGQDSSAGDGRREAMPEVGSLTCVARFSVSLVCHCLAVRLKI